MLFINEIQLVTRVRNNMRNMLMRAEDKIMLRKRPSLRLSTTI